MGSYRSQEAGHPLTNGGRDEGENAGHAQLRPHLSAGAPTFLLAALVPIVAAYITTNTGQLMTTAHPSPIDMFALSALFFGASSYAAAAALRSSFLVAAEWLNRIKELCAAVGFASLVAVILHERFWWVAYAFCVTAAAHLLGSPCFETLQRLVDVVHARFFGGASTQRGIEDRDGTQQGMEDRDGVV